MELARALYGPAHPIVLEALLSEADTAAARTDYARADALLLETDGSLRSSGQDGGLLRADWWRVKARTLGAAQGKRDERARALEQSIAIYEKVAPKSNELAAALNMVANDLTTRGEHVRAKEVLERALAVRQAAPVRNEARIAELFINLARKEERLGLLDDADRTYQGAEDQIRQTVGERKSTYWIARAYHARLLHMRGLRERADAVFQETLRAIPPEWKTNVSDDWFREIYGSCLAADGRASDAIPLLESAHRRYIGRPQTESDVREVRRELGDAYDGAGRAAEARAMLKLSRDEYIAKEPADSEWTLRARERWARFLADHAEPGGADREAAETELRDVLEKAAGRPLAVSTLAHAGLSHIARLRGDAKAAIAESGLALAALDRLQGLYDVRVAPYVWLEESASLLAGGDDAAARGWAAKALEASLRYDAPASPAIAGARAAVGAADRRVP
jgi:hypothetical protein